MREYTVHPYYLSHEAMAWTDGVDWRDGGYEVSYAPPEGLGVRVRSALPGQKPDKYDYLMGVAWCLV